LWRGGSDQHTDGNDCADTRPRSLAALGRTTVAALDVLPVGQTRSYEV
jgi:hypothetical protein